MNTNISHQNMVQALMKALYQNNLPTITDLLNQGVNVNLPYNDNGWTPFMWVCKEFYETDIVKQFLAYGGNIHSRNKAGETPFMIAAENHKLSEIASAMQVESNRLTPYLETLQGLYLLEKRVPVTEHNPEKSRKGLYVMRDIFMRFWFKFVFPYKGELELDNLNFVLSKLNEHFIDNHVAFVYEDICRNIFAELCKKRLIDFVPSRIGSYWGKNEEIDLVAVDESNKRIFAAECKYYKDDKPVDVGVFAKLQEKCKTKDFSGNDITYGLFSKSGFTSRLKEIAAENNKLILINGVKMEK